MRIKLSFKTCLFWMASEISWEVQKYLLGARAASLILLDMTYWGSSHSDFLSLVGLQVKHAYILHNPEWDFQVFKCMCCEEVLWIGYGQDFKKADIWKENGKPKCNVVSQEVERTGTPDAWTGRWGMVYFCSSASLLTKILMYDLDKNESKTLIITI